MTKTDIIIIGSGLGGLEVALMMAKEGKTGTYGYSEEADALAKRILDKLTECVESFESRYCHCTNHRFSLRQPCEVTRRAADTEALHGHGGFMQAKGHHAGEGVAGGEQLDDVSPFPAHGDAAVADKVEGFR